MLAVLRSDAGGECDSEGEAETAPAAAPEREVPPQFDGVPVTYPDWRLEELARKYSDDEPVERERGFYHPYG